MQDRTSLLWRVLLAAAVMAGLGAYPVLRFSGPGVAAACAAGALLATLNALAGCAAVAYAFDRSFTTFLKAVLGGMGLRLALVFGVLLALILGAGMHAVALTVSTLAFYLVFLALEVSFIHTHVAGRTQDGQ